MHRATRLLPLLALAAVVTSTVWWTQRGHGTVDAPAAQRAGAAKHQCPMHPNVVSDGPGQCPICGMALARVEPEPAAAPAHADPAASRAPFSLSPERAQMIGVTTAAIEYRELHRDVRSAGTVAFDPELYGALSDYRDVRETQAALEATPSAELHQRLDRMRRALTLRVNLIGLSFGQLEAVIEAGAEPVHLLLPGASAWIYGRFYEVGPYEPRPGQPVVVTAPDLPGRVFSGHVVTVDVPRELRAEGARVRALVATPGGGLRPGSFVHLVVQAPLGRLLAVPEDAVLDTGRQRLVFVHHADGRFEPRDVVLGVEAEGYHEVLSGLAPGERVVTAANFLIDSESRFRAALAAFAAAEAP